MRKILLILLLLLPINVKAEITMLDKPRLFQHPYWHDKKWRNHPILKYVEDLFRSRIFKVELLKSRDELYRETYRLQTAIKDHLDMMRSSEEIETQGPFFGRRGESE